MENVGNIMRPNTLYEDDNLSISVYHIGKWRDRKRCPKCGERMSCIAKELCHRCQATENLKHTPNHKKHMERIKNDVGRKTA